MGGLIGIVHVRIYSSVIYLSEIRTTKPNYFPQLHNPIVNVGSC